ncbi:lipopolysaccharide biosynthesis protein [Marinobacter sp. 2_MG-2023]|uniref:lipopolysaccharide biosynthesis protein n=1 Tax=Marinobacter sp. 2_MG-2023 TaxID=3062679 RepID=UPI0026E3BCC3|nr:oligosaccharide flippase family protein [Marinobacter sp. 2_MG-2023]MDO6443713.1 oligosaccharide flippase family protein [Marinobacter sp. 2_MG-2023]
MLGKIRRSSLFSEAGIYLVVTLINASIPFLLLPILTRYLTPEKYGVVAVFQVWCSLLSVLCGLNTYGAATRKHYDYDEPDTHMGDYISACVTILVISVIIVTILLLPFLGLLSEVLGLSQGWLLAGALFASGSFMVQLRLRQWQVRKKPVKYGQFQISQSVLNMGLSLFLVVLLTMGVDGRLIGLTSAMFFFGAVGALLLWRDELLKFTWQPTLMKDALEFSLPLLPHFAGSFLLLTVDRAIISSVLGLEAAGHYMVAVQLALALNLILQSFHKAYVPWLFERIKRDNAEEKKQIVKGSYCYFIILLIVVFLAFIFGGPVLIIVAGPGYEPAGEILPWLFLAQAIRGMYYIVSSYLLYAKKTQQISKITILSGVISVAFLIFFLKTYGLIGAAWAGCVGASVQFLLTWYTASRAIVMPWSPRKLFLK